LKIVKKLLPKWVLLLLKGYSNPRLHLAVKESII
jgi:hypothetical protein